MELELPREPVLSVDEDVAAIVVVAVSVVHAMVVVVTVVGDPANVGVNGGDVTRRRRDISSLAMGPNALSMLLVTTLVGLNEKSDCDWEFEKFGILAVKPLIVRLLLLLLVVVLVAVDRVVKFNVSVIGSSLCRRGNRIWQMLHMVMVSQH